MPRHRRPRAARRQHLAALATAALAGIVLVPTGGLPLGPVSLARGSVGVLSADHDTRAAAAAKAAAQAEQETEQTVTAARSIPGNLTALKREADLAQVQLTDATRRWQMGQQRLVRAQAQAMAARAQARQAAATAATAQAALGRIAAAAYRRPDANYALIADKEPGDLLSAAGTLDFLGGRQATQVRRLVAARQQAQLLATEAGRLETEAAAQAAAVAAERQALTRRATQITSALTTALDRLESQRRASRRAQRAAVPGCSPRPGFAEFPNGLIPSDALCPLPQAGHMLRADAALAFYDLNDAYKARFGKDICITDSYRSLAEQRGVYSRKPGLAAVPGTSNHGWGLAVDLCDGASQNGSAVYRWLDDNGDRFGWDNPDWARPGGTGPHEAWHWEYKAAR